MPAEIDQITYDTRNQQHRAGPFSGPSPEVNLRTPLWGSYFDPKTGHNENDKDCQCNCRRVQISSQKVCPKRSSFLGGLEVNLSVGGVSCTLVRGPKSGPFFWSRKLGHHATEGHGTQSCQEVAAQDSVTGLFQASWV